MNVPSLCFKHLGFGWLLVPFLDRRCQIWCWTCKRYHHNVVNPIFTTLLRVSIALTKSLTYLNYLYIIYDWVSIGQHPNIKPSPKSSLVIRW